MQLGFRGNRWVCFKVAFIKKKNFQYDHLLQSYAYVILMV